MKGWSFFIAGIIQGSIADLAVHAQDYRREIRNIIERYVEGARVYCPFENHPNSLEYDNETASRVFFDHVAMAAKTDMLITFLPEASMGTAVEMYAANQAGRAVVTISPLEANWAVKFLSDEILPDMEALREYAMSGRLVELLERRYGSGH